MIRFTACLSLVLFSVSVFASAPSGLEGRLLGVDGRPAAGYRVVLISAAGEELAQATADERGTYRFDALQAGEYGLGVLGPQGEAGPVLAAPASVQPGETVVRDIRLLAGSPPVRPAPAAGGVDVWWAGLSRKRKVWSVVGTLAGIGLLYGVTQSDQAASEIPVSPFRAYP